MIRLQFATKFGDDTNGTEGRFHVNATRHSPMPNHWPPILRPFTEFPVGGFFSSELPWSFLAGTEQ
jgi:hypothetical protein